MAARWLESVASVDGWSRGFWGMGAAWCHAIDKEEEEACVSWAVRGS
jgi:hypothetical protein